MKNNTIFLLSGLKKCSFPFSSIIKLRTQQLNNTILINIFFDTIIMLNEKTVVIIVIVLVALFSFWVVLPSIDNWISKQALAKEDEQVCNFIFFNQIDKDFCFQNIAFAKQNESICFKAGNLESGCFGTIAKNKTDMGICENIEAGYDKNLCYEFIAMDAKDLSICEKMQGFAKGDCYLYFAVIEKNSTICEEIENTYKVPSSSGAGTYGIRNSCFERIAVENKDLTLCDKVNDTYADEHAKDECLKAIAVAKLDFTICEKITTQNGRDRCYTEVAIYKKDSTICNKIVDGYEKGSCQNLAK